MSASAVARRVPRLRLPAPSLNLFLVAMAFFVASFVAGDTRVLAATVKLGMGYDKSDIRFVIHFQLPQNLIAYYQQIGRAGRDGKPAYAFLLHGEEDEEILTHFIATAQASPNLLKDIVGMARSGVRYGEMLKALNVKGGKLDEALKYLLVHDYLYRDKSVYRASFGKAFDAAAEREKRDQITKTRIAEHEALIGYLDSTDCFMKHVAAELDAPDAQETCGICANCRGGFIVPVSADQSTVAAATRYLGGRHGGFSVDLYRRCGRAAGSRRFERVSFCASQNEQWGLNEREIHRRAEDSQIDKH